MSLRSPSAERSHEPITEDLIEAIEGDPALGQLLERSIERAAAVNPDPETNPVRDLEEYYQFVDRAAKLVPRNVLANPERLTRDRLLQAICYFHFLVDQPLPELENEGLYRNSIQYYDPFSEWLHSFAEEWGSFLDTEASWSQRIYEQFHADPRFNLGQGWYESPTNWSSFNDFFTRRLATPDERPIDAPEDDSVVVSPADAVPQGTWSIDADGRIEVSDEPFAVKDVAYYDVGALFGPESDYRRAFDGGTLTHTFLSIYDYHRYHVPVSGDVVETGQIDGNVALDVRWDDQDRRYLPADTTGWQFAQNRGYAIIDTDDYGLVAVIPVGMAQISSVAFGDAIESGSHVTKGEELGTFRFGGSDIVMCFQSDVDFELTVPTEADSDDGALGSSSPYEHCSMGEAYGQLRT